MAQGFDISIIRQYWLGSDPDAATCDLSSHGPLRIVVGDQVITDETFEYGISNTALALLRTLSRNHSPSAPVAECYPGCPRLVFHGCGTIPMIGCPIGVDWIVEHLPGDRVRISDVRRYDTTSKTPTLTFPGLIAEVTCEGYRTTVTKFAQLAKSFYSNQPKVIKENWDREAYEKYWQEFDLLLRQHT